MTSSINTNIAALSAQVNIASASALASSSVARLSSGNRIVQASDDVAALAIGNSIGAQVSTLKTAQTNASQANSLLQVADGALAQIQAILQQQQSIANQAQSGSLTDTDRGFLNQQFQALTSEINSIATGTQFNGVNLIDGSIATGGSNNPLHNATIDTSTGTINFAGQTNSLTGFTGAISFSQPAAANDAAFYGDLSHGTAAVTLNGAIGSTFTSYHITYVINGVTYAGNLAEGTNDGAVAGGGTVNLIAANHGTIALTVGATGIGAADNHVVLATALTNYLAGATAFSASNSATISGQVAQTGIAVASAYNDVGQNDTALVGALSAGVFQVTGDTSLGYSISYSLNGTVYQGSLTAAQVTAGHTLVLDNGKGSLAFVISSSNTSTASASAFQTALTNVFAGATAFAIHKVATTLATDASGNSIAGSAITTTQTAGTLLNGFSGSKVELQSALFSTTHLPPVADFSGTGSGTSTVLSVVVNGVTYSTAGTVAGTGTTISATTFNGVTTALDGATVSTGLVTFYKNGDTTSKEQLQLNLNGLQSDALITTTGDVANLVSALNTVFGSGGSAGGLTFQLGATSTANVTVNIANAQSSALFGGTTLDVSTAGDAAIAASTVTTALNSVSAIRAGVGANESQVNFAAANLASSVQNQTAAQSSLLDTDVAAESTNFATEQVKLQAGISVLAQANQQLQALLKLIG